MTAKTCTGNMEAGNKIKHEAYYRMVGLTVNSTAHVLPSIVSLLISSPAAVCPRGLGGSGDVVCTLTNAATHWLCAHIVERP